MENVAEMNYRGHGDAPCLPNRLRTAGASLCSLWFNRLFSALRDFVCNGQRSEIRALQSSHTTIRWLQGVDTVPKKLWVGAIGGSPTPQALKQMKPN